MVLVVREDCLFLIHPFLTELCPFFKYLLMHIANSCEHNSYCSVDCLETIALSPMVPSCALRLHFLRGVKTTFPPGVLMLR